MSILTRGEINRRIGLGDIKIEPFSPDQVGPASIDLTLDKNFRVFKASEKLHDIKEDINIRDEDFTDLVEAQDTFILEPGQTILGITVEKITLPNNLCGWLEGRSRFARMGLTIHITAGFVQPGVSNKQVLEIVNMGPIRLALHPGTRVAQLILEDTIGKAKYEGIFVSQDKP